MNWEFKNSSVSIWLGDFDSEDNFDKYIKKQFKLDYEIGPPLGVWWNIYKPEAKSLEELIGECEFSKSFIESVRAKSQNRKLYNSCIVRYNMTHSPECSLKDNIMFYTGVHKYNSSYGSIFCNEPQNYEVENKVSIWLGNFKSEQSFKSYIEEIGNEDDYQSEFASDFEIDFYDHDFFEGFSTKNMQKINTPEIIKKASYSHSFDERHKDDLEKLNFKEANSLIVLYDIDYEVIKNEYNYVKSSNKNFVYLGTYDYKKHA